MADLLCHGLDRSGAPVDFDVYADGGITQGSEQIMRTV
jgi:hypothetical protein